MFKPLSRPGKNIYVGAVLRDLFDKIVLDIGHYIGRPVTITEFIHYVVERHGDEAKENLKHILGTEEERERAQKMT
ncbi:hypothetical protein BJP41_05030 [Candidatus Williamhamiltonella defendens]|uniref:Uncharacterized protein n=1 Tax=Candidatus Williamhamiltonella defendens TaxID=138072 RepID=A0A2D3T1W2_9ENTR|nr:hypothetical protein [Candidatus Hamiltonella defensa]ATW29802.1 hypothetical protein BJP41_05030 [Candidatus Hamiltonella defensa]ATW31776.1 hypothetical protein BJP42_05110 [Candidatus Hamiltonella defensa]